MKAVNTDINKIQSKSNEPPSFIKKLEATTLQGTMRYAFGPGMSIRYATEMRAVQQAGRLPFLKSSNLHEDVLKGNLGPGYGLGRDSDVVDDESCRSRLDYL